MKLFSRGLLNFIVRSKMYRYKNVSWVLEIDQFFFSLKEKLNSFFISMYISNLIYKCYKWNKYWWMLYLFHLNKWKRNYLLYANKIYGLEPDIWKIGHGIFYENHFLLLNFSINCPVLYDFIHVYSFFSSCYCILGDFFSIVYTYIIFFFIVL